jgi:DNA modification methylase
MVKEKQGPMGDELFGTPMADAAPASTATEEAAAPLDTDLDAIQADSERQALPDQEKVFRVAKRVRSKLHNLPDPTKPPLGFVNGRGFDVVFPFIKLPHLAPNLNGDWVQFGSPDLAPNRLYYGDNLQVLRTLSSNSIDLIYIDPPFFSGAEYNVIWGDTNEVRTFSDIWEGGLDTYLIWLNARLWEMRRALKVAGSIYVHCDWHASHYIKAEMDKVFGYENFRNEIAWKRTSAHGNVGQRYAAVQDTILFYSKSAKWHWNPAFNGYSEEYIRSHYGQIEKETGRQFTTRDLTASMQRASKGQLYEWRGFRPPPTRCWAYTIDKMEEFHRTGRLVYSNRGMPRLKLYLDEMPGNPVDDVWTDIPPINSQAAERLGYPTQKPEALLERVVSASSEPGQLVADFFCGGGVTPVVAERLGRRWIACDSSRVAVSVTLDRLVKLGEEMSGVTSNYGKVGTVQAKMELPTPETAVPDIRVHYVGVYPMDRFKAVDQDDFEKFILQCLAAQADNSELPITGWRSGREPLKVGPADPDRAPDAKDVQEFFQAVVKRLQPNVRTLARYVCWRASPQLIAYRRRLSDYIRKNIQPRGADVDFDFLLIDSEDFRERIRQKYPDADDNEFLLRFTKEPVVGAVVPRQMGPLSYEFEAQDAASTNAGGYLVNCQWDFDYQRGHFAADREYVLGRQELKGKDAKLPGRKFEAVLTARHKFEKGGRRTAACRVQDNLGAEAIRTVEVDVA